MRAPDNATVNPPRITTERPFRYYRRLVDPAGKHYPVLHHYLPQSALDALMGETGAELEQFQLCLSAKQVRNLAWAVSVMRLTDLKEESSHPDVLQHNELQRAHERTDAVMQQLSEQELASLIAFHRKHKSSAAEVFENLLLAAIGYAHARQPSWGQQPRRCPAWYQDAVYLMMLLEGVRERRTKRLASFTKKEAPAVKLIQWALGKKQTLAAIAQALRRRT